LKVLDLFVRTSEVLQITSFIRTALSQDNESRAFPEVSTHQRWSQGLAGISAGDMAGRPRKLEKASANRFPPAIK
jgi:hypothetical protein